MIERLGRDMVVNGDVLSMADYYEGIDDTPDGAVIDKIISGIDPKETAPVRDASAFGRSVLYYADKNLDPTSIRTSVAEHPASQNIPAARTHSLANDLIQAYDEEIKWLEGHQKAAGPAKARHDIAVVILRNPGLFDDTELEKIVEKLESHE